MNTKDLATAGLYKSAFLPLYNPKLTALYGGLLGSVGGAGLGYIGNRFRDEGERKEKLKTDLLAGGLAGVLGGALGGAVGGGINRFNRRNRYEEAGLGLLRLHPYAQPGFVDSEMDRMLDDTRVNPFTGTSNVNEVGTRFTRSYNDHITENTPSARRTIQDQLLKIFGK